MVAFRADAHSLLLLLLRYHYVTTIQINALARLASQNNKKDPTSWPLACGSNNKQTKGIRTKWKSRNMFSFLNVWKTLLNKVHYAEKWVKLADVAQRKSDTYV